MLLLAAALGAAPADARPAAGQSGFEAVTIPLIADGKPDSADTAVAGYLFRPAGDGPFPAAILIHGCNGYDWLLSGQPGWALFKRYAERYVAHGYAALVLDSFEPRGVSTVCGNTTLVPPEQRAFDVWSAARWLGARGDIDMRRLVLQGDSHGGSTTLMTLAAGGWRGPEHFAAGIAFYPYCRRARGFATPLLILIGDADDWTPASLCQEMLRRLPGSDVVLKTFPGATHAFDFPLPARRNRLGHFMTYDAAATEASWQAIDAFLAEHVK